MAKPAKPRDIYIPNLDIDTLKLKANLRGGINAEMAPGLKPRNFDNHVLRPTTNK